MGNLDLELVKDLLNGLNVRLQVFGFLRDIGQRCGKNHVQVEIQDAVHSVAGKRRLERCESARVGMELLSVFAHFVSISWLRLRRGTYFKRFCDALVQKHYVQIIVCRLQREGAQWTDGNLQHLLKTDGSDRWSGAISSSSKWCYSRCLGNIVVCTHIVIPDVSVVFSEHL